MACFANRTSGLLFVFLLSSCGARTGLFQGVDQDASAPWQPTCGRREQVTSVGRVHRVQATLPEGITAVTEGWQIEEWPTGSLASNAPTDQRYSEFVADRLGFYRLLYTVTATDGETGTCIAEVEAIAGPPRALCPEEEIVTRIDEPVEVIGEGFDDVLVTSIEWSLLTPGANITPVREGVVEFVSSNVGSYDLELLVSDADGSTDTCVATVRVNGPPTVICPPGPISAPTRQALNLEVEASDVGGGPVGVTWTLPLRPIDSTAALVPTIGLQSSIIPDRQGAYQALVVARDEDGEEDSCTIDIIGTPTPPSVTCLNSDTNPLVTTNVSATVVDDGTIVSQSWRLTRRPTGSNANGPNPSTGSVVAFTPDIAGEYDLEFSARDNDGNTVTCVSLVRAVATEGLRVEIFWDTNGTDMDTHLLRPEATSWNNEGDCYYANCRNNQLQWGVPGDIDNPTLDIDDTDGFGPENINIRMPYNGTYRVGVLAFSGAARVTVRVYCGGSTTAPRQTFGPVAIGNGGGRRLWRVADVAISGTDCTITDLASGGAPNLSDNIGVR